MRLSEGLEKYVLGLSRVFPLQDAALLNEVVVERVGQRGYSSSDDDVEAAVGN